MVSAFDLLVLSQIPQIGANRLRALVSHFGGTSPVFIASAREIAAVEGISRPLASSIVRSLRDRRTAEARAFAERQLSMLNKAGGTILAFWDQYYPDLLKKIYDPPPLLFARGDYHQEDALAIAVVGTRSPSAYGAALAEEFSSALARRGLTVVSGLARGIDTIAHGAALQAGGRTIAVVGSGLDVVYPPENRGLFQRIAGHGLVLSECEMGAKPDAVNFPRRNRIISGLSLGTLIIETDLTGGAMITANAAIDQNREIFAVPGDVRNKRSHGCNVLIKEGRAKLVEGIDDIVVELGPKLPPLFGRSKANGMEAGRTPPPDLTLFEKTVYDVLTIEPSHVDRLAEEARLSSADVLVNLLSLEFKGLVKQLPGKFFMKK
ncbi:MAG: DNA protecting protein DprA [Ignavibacteria bacterium 13_1_40CM_2_61_4]|nr:MAG: DNA protecting protein DprA [Ignavibacteria bacterium 13_1_40CM_2_61_4]